MVDLHINPLWHDMAIEVMRPTKANLGASYENAIPMIERRGRASADMGQRMNGTSVDESSKIRPMIGHNRPLAGRTHMSTMQTQYGKNRPIDVL